MTITIHGTIQQKEDRQGLPDLTVEAYDADLFGDELLGIARSDANGGYAIACPAEAGTGDRPDVFLKIRDDRGQLIYNTRNRIVADVTRGVVLDVRVPRMALVRAGLEEPAAVTPPKVAPGREIELKAWSMRDDGDLDNSLLGEVYKDLEPCGSILELFHGYKRHLDRGAGNDDPVYRKLDALFDVGRTPEVVQGHFYGIALGIRVGCLPESMDPFGNLLGQIWGASLSDECPWVGKSLTSVVPDKLAQLTGRTVASDQPMFLGLNHFNRIQTRLLNPMAFQVLNFWMELHPAPEEERAAYGWERNGACFIGHMAPSVCHPAARPVFQLNYRHQPLGNRVPNCWLIDELVEISPGLLLGQLCYATRKLMGDYEPDRPASDYQYLNFGYFLLLDAHWHAEARRLFPYLEIPSNAPAMCTPDVSQAFGRSKFSTLTRQSPPMAICDEARFQQAQRAIGQYPTLMHYFQACARDQQDHLSNDSPYFDQLAELFNQGIAPRTMAGFYNGALVSWRSAGFFDLFGINTINLVYTRVGAPFSTWTGKCFEPISGGRLREITDGHETGRVPTAWGANTQSLRTLKERFVGRLMDIADIWTEPAGLEEKRALGYDVKNFFFIARQGLSVSRQSAGKTVYQFNYRWPRLKTIIPDRYCIDEVVQIAEGLFLGRLMYATNIVTPYDPGVDPAVYKYELFGYFLLMDRQWHQIRLAIGYDLDNI